LARIPAEASSWLRTCTTCRPAAAFSRLAADRSALVPYVEPYQPGRFYLRGLRPLRAVLDGLDQMALLIIDRYAGLDPDGPAWALAPATSSAFR
jgi:hypothetical protein